MQLDAMQTVWLVCTWCIEDFTIIAVCSTEEKAKAFVTRAKDLTDRHTEWWIEPWFVQ